MKKKCIYFLIYNTKKAKRSYVPYMYKNILY